MTSNNNQLREWLFNPFKFIAGGKALVLGLAMVLTSGLLASAGGTHFDGVLDVHAGLEAPVWCFVAEGLVNWICMAIPLFFFGLALSTSAPRFIDVFGTQALARGPYLITAVVMLPEANRRFGQYIMSKLDPAAQAPPINYVDLVIFALALIAAIFMAVWTVALMYRAYSVSCNVRGPKAIISFILSLMGAEVLSKFVIFRLII